MPEFVSATPFHPGEYIKDEMEARGWTQEDLAEVMGISRRQIVNLLQGKSGITAETAVALAAAFEGQSATTWMNLQSSYELAQVKKEKTDSALLSRIFEKAPVRELRRRNWISGTKDLKTLEREVCSFLSVNSINEEPAISFAARKGTGYEQDTSSQVAWYCRARQLAERVHAKSFAADFWDAGVKELVKLAAYPEDVRKVPSTLADMGIRFLVVEQLKGTKIDGVALWLDDDTPAIALSLRYDRIDNFWFTLLHELTHIKYHDTSCIDVELDEADDSLPDIEKRANAEAAEAILAKESIESFIHRNRPIFYASKIAQFSAARGIHPGIVVGQLQKRKELSYQQLRQFLVKVRSEVICNSLTDGWGNSLR